MYLSLLYPNPNNAQARKDLADPYAMHQTLSRIAGPEDRVLWRLETGRYGENPRVLVQTQKPPRWEEVLSRWKEPYGELAPDSPKEVRLKLRPGQLLRFRLYANPTVTREGKRLGLYREEDQLNWLFQRLKARGAVVHKALVSRREKKNFKKRGETITLATAQFDGVLEVTDPERLLQTIEQGIGHGKAFGLGLLSVAPYRD